MQLQERQGRLSLDTHLSCGPTTHSSKNCCAEQQKPWPMKEATCSNIIDAKEHDKPKKWWGGMISMHNGNLILYCTANNLFDTHPYQWNTYSVCGSGSTVHCKSMYIPSDNGRPSVSRMCWDQIDRLHTWFNIECKLRIFHVFCKARIPHKICNLASNSLILFPLFADQECQIILNKDKIVIENVGVDVFKGYQEHTAEFMESTTWRQASKHHQCTAIWWQHMLSTQVHLKSLINPTSINLIAGNLLWNLCYLANP